MTFAPTLAVAAALLAFPATAPAARATTIDPPAAPVAAAPLLLDVTATIPLRGRAEPGATVELTAPCSLRLCATSARAGGKGRWRARLHVVVPPHRRAVTVRAGTVTRSVTLEAPAPATGAPELAVIGDSLAQGTAPHLPELLPGWRVTVDAARSRFLWTGMVIRDAMRKPSRRRVALAFSLFTNDDPSRAADLAAAVRRSLDGLPRGSCALWATIARPKVAGVSYAEANRQLEAIAAEEPGIVVVPWARAVKLHPEWLRKDRVHATPEGYRARAELYAEAARSCGL